MGQKPSKEKKEEISPSIKSKSHHEESQKYSVGGTGSIVKSRKEIKLRTMKVRGNFQAPGEEGGDTNFVRGGVYQGSIGEEDEEMAQWDVDQTTRNMKVDELKTAMKNIVDRQKEYILNLKTSKESMRKREEEDLKGVTGIIEKGEGGFEDPSRIGGAVNFKILSNFHTFFDANMVGFKVVDGTATRPFKYNLKNVKASLFLKKVNEQEDGESAVNILFETFCNYKLGNNLKEVGFTKMSVYCLPEKLKLQQKKIRLNALKNELLKLLRADPYIKEIDIIAIKGNTRRTGNLEDSRIQFPSDPKHDFFKEFKLDVLNEIGSTSIFISKKSQSSSSQPKDHCTLICPDIASFQLRLVDNLNLEFLNAEVLTSHKDNNFLDIYRIYCRNGEKFIINVLPLKSLSKSWDPIFNMLQEFKAYSNHLYNKLHFTHILSFKDYFLTPHPTYKFSSLCFLYEDYCCTLRDIMNDKKSRSEPFTTLEITKIFTDIIKGLSTLHKLGIVHRNLKPENIVYSSSKGLFMVAGLSLAAFFNKEDAICQSFDLVGTPFYKAIEEFADLGIENGKLKFMLDPFKADVYSIGVMMMECIWVNIQISDNQVGDLKAVFCIPEVVNLDHFLHVCELKHKQHNLFLSIIQNSPGYLKRLSGYDSLRRVLENIIFEDVSARYDVYQTKAALLKILTDITDSELRAMKFQVDKIRERNCQNYTQKENLVPDELLICMKKSLFLKEVHLFELANILDRSIEKLWDQNTIKELKVDYIEFVISRIKNLAKIEQLNLALALVSEQLEKCEQSQAYDSDYQDLAIQCLIVKSEIMFVKNDVEEFFKSSKECESLLPTSRNASSQETSLMLYKLKMNDMLMSFILLNDLETKNKIRGFLENLVSILKITTDPALIILPILISTMLANLKDTKELDFMIKVLRDLEDKIVASSKDNFEVVIQIYLLIAFFKNVQGNHVAVFEYSRKITKVMVGQSEENLMYKILREIAVLMSSSQLDYETGNEKVSNLLRFFRKVKDQSYHNMQLLIFFLREMILKFGTPTDLKELMEHSIMKLDELSWAGGLGSLRLKILLIEILTKNMHYDAAREIYKGIKGCIFIIERHSQEIDKLYWLIQLESEIMYSQGMYFDACKEYQDISIKIRNEFGPPRFEAALMNNIEHQNFFNLLKCYVKLRNFKDALPLAKNLLNLNNEVSDFNPLKLKVLMLCIRVFLSVDEKLVKDVPVRILVNKIISEGKSCHVPLLKIDIMFFLSYHVYMRLRIFQKAKRCIDDSLISKILSQQNTKKDQAYLMLTFRRKQLRTWLKIFGLNKNEPKISQKIAKCMEGIIKYICVNPSPYDQITIIKSFTIIAKAYLMMGMAHESLINISKIKVSLSGYGVEGLLYLRSKVDYIAAKVNFLKGRTEAAHKLGLSALKDFKKFFGEESSRTRRLYKFMQKVCNSDPSYEVEAAQYAETLDQDDEDESNPSDNP